MKRIILILFFLFKFLFSSQIVSTDGHVWDISLTYYSSSSNYFLLHTEYIDGVKKDILDYQRKKYIISLNNSFVVNTTCLKDYYSSESNFYVGSNNGCSFISSSYSLYSTLFNNVSYCISPGSDYVYSTSSHYWVNTSTGEILCPEGQRYNSSTEQCEDIPECPTGSELDQMAVEKCKSLDFVQNEECNPDTGDINITCKTCNEVLQMLSDYCVAHNGVLPDGTYSCNRDPHTTALTINFSSDFNVSMCEYPSNNENNSSSDNSSGSNYSDNNNSNFDNTNNTSNDSNSSSNSGSSGSNNNDSSNNNNNDNNNDNNTCPDPCSIYKNVGVQVTSSTVNGYTCFTITYPTYGDNCILKYHTSDNTQSGPNCVAGCNDSSSTNVTNNVTTATVNVDMSGVEERLDSINQKLDEFKNITPDSNFSIEGSIDSDIESFFNTYKDFFNNIGSDLENIKGSFDSVKSMLKKDQYSLSLPSDIFQCPLTITLYKTTQSIDICKFISPYRPLLQIFFTLFFNISVLAFFFKVIINRGEK
ncbi:hypothetical protein [Nautilia lithotrophica]